LVFGPLKTRNSIKNRTLRPFENPEGAATPKSKTLPKVVPPARLLLHAILPTLNQIFDPWICLAWKVVLQKTTGSRRVYVREN
jgi:hypothetical protein